MNILQPRIIIAATTVAVIILLVSLAQEMNRRLQVQREVQRLEEQVAKMERSVIALENLNQYFSTDAYQERLAREKLNYRAPGEKVVLISSTDEAARGDASPDAAERTVGIAEKWWRIFFVESGI